MNERPFGTHPDPRSQIEPIPKSVSDEELLQWADKRADDAGRLARELVQYRRLDFHPPCEALAPGEFDTGAGIVMRTDIPKGNEPK